MDSARGAVLKNVYPSECLPMFVWSPLSLIVLLNFFLLMRFVCHDENVNGFKINIGTMNEQGFSRACCF